MNTFSATACIRYGWDAFWKRPWFFIGAIVVYFIMICILDAISSTIFAHLVGLTWLAVLVNWLVEVVAGMGLISFALHAHDDLEHASIANLWHPQQFWRYLGAYLLFVIIFVCGLVLLVIPGIIFGIMFGFAMYVVIDHGSMPIDALKESARITKGHRWELLELGILSALVMILGVICLGIGFFVALPVILLANVHAYRLLSSASTVTVPV